VLKVYTRESSIRVNTKDFEQFVGSKIAQLFANPSQLEKYEDGVFLNRNTQAFHFMLDCVQYKRELDASDYDKLTKEIAQFELQDWGVVFPPPNLARALAKPPTLEDYPELDTSKPYFTNFVGMKPSNWSKMREIDRAHFEQLKDTPLVKYTNRQWEQ